MSVPGSTAAAAHRTSFMRAGGEDRPSAPPVLRERLGARPLGGDTGGLAVRLWAHIYPGTQARTHRAPRTEHAWAAAVSTGTDSQPEQGFGGFLRVSAVICNCQLALSPSIPWSAGGATHFADSGDELQEGVDEALGHLKMESPAQGVTTSVPTHAAVGAPCLRACALV